MSTSFVTVRGILRRVQMNGRERGMNLDELPFLLSHSNYYLERLIHYNESGVFIQKRLIHLSWF